MPATLTTDVGDQARSALQESPIYDLRHLQVERQNETLLISGRVSTFYHKQLAQEVVRAVSGRTRVVNSVEVG